MQIRRPRLYWKMSIWSVVLTLELLHASFDCVPALTIVALTESRWIK